MEEVKLVVNCQNILGEGPVWSVDEQKLYWTDIESLQLWQLDPASGETLTWDMPEKVCSIAFREQGGLLIAFASGLAFYDLKTGEQRRIQDIEPELPMTRLNDGRCDRQGRFVVGGFDTGGQGRAGAYRLDPDLSVHELFRGLSSANSTCFSPDGRIMYYANTPEGEIWAFDYDPETGLISNRRTFCRFEDQPGIPDGSIIDAEGYLWNAQWNGFRVVRYTPGGEVDRVIEMPCMNPTCVGFGGKDLDTLFITSARFHMTPEQIEEQPASGGLFAVKPGVRGLSESKFAG